MGDSEVMHNPESKVSNDNNEEVDIYSDVLSDQDSLIAKLKEKVDKLSQEKGLLLKSLSSIQKNYEELRKEYGVLDEKYKALSFNSASLFKTAQAEIKRKDRLIYELRKEKDDLIFRKTSVNQALYRSRRVAVLSPRKYKSPIKKRQVNKPNHESSRLIKASLEDPEHTSPIKEPLKEEEIFIKQNPEEVLENPIVTNEPPVELGDSRSPKIPSEESKNSILAGKIQEVNDDSKVLTVQPDKETLENKLPSHKNSSDENLNISNKLKSVPPPFTGPSTAYSRRLYKRLHGISPPKADSKFTNNGIVPKNIELQKKVKCLETEVTKNDCKEETITSKLQKEVQEIIKLGTPSKSSPPSTTKLSPEKLKSHVGLDGDKSPKKTPPKPLAEKLIIQCDLRNTPKGHQQISQNSVSINETIDNILKKQRAGYYSHQKTTISNMKEEEPKKDSSCSDPVSKSASKLLTNSNKRATDKLMISPATFGKLVSNSVKIIPNMTQPSKGMLEKSTIESKSELRKRKLSDSVSPGNRISPQSNQRTRHETYPKITKKTKFISSLFGDSPMKSDIVDIKEPKLSPTKNSASPIGEEQRSSSPIFPDSPSLDSDNHEDLIIDTTACSQNTSPRVSECEIKDVDEISVKAEVKTTTRIKKSEERLLSENDEKKDSGTYVENLADCNTSDIKTSLSSLKGANHDQNKLLLEANKRTDKQKEEESLISLPPAETTNGIKIVEEVISKCQQQSEKCPVESNEEQNKSCASSKSNHTKADHLTNLNLENTHSSGSLDKVSSPEKSSESQSLPPSEYNNTVFNATRKEGIEIARFIPSPPQLTLVSAFKHSENSVFALAEDTLGFVSALTRMRDISPIRTPIKKDNSSKEPLSQSQQSESESVRKNDTNFEFLKPFNHDIQNKSNSLTLGLSQLEGPPSKLSTQNNPSSVVPNPSSYSNQLLKSDTERFLQHDNAHKSDSAENNQPPQSRNLELDKNSKNILETPKILTPHPENKIVVNNKKYQSQQNPFRRKTPARRIRTEKKNEVKLSNIQPTKNPSKLKDSSCVQEIPGSENLKKIIPPKKSVKEIELCKLENKPYEEKIDADKMLSEVKLLDQVRNPSNTSAIGEKGVVNVENEGQAKQVPSISIAPTSNEKVKTFKRSESLKMAQKPLPRNYLNVIKNMESKKSKDVLETSMNKTRNFIEISPKEDKPDKKSDIAKNVDKNSEVEQISHIASINKKLRVSKYQSKSDKENSTQLKPSETLVSCEKNSNISHKPVNQTSVVGGNFKSLPENVKEKIKPHSTSLNVSSRSNRRNDRRSVSLGPEIRLGIHINLPSIQKDKSRIKTLINSPKDNVNIEPAKKSEYLLMKSSPNQISEITSKKSDDSLRIESLSKEKVLKSDSRISTCNIMNKKTKENSQSDLRRSPSPKRHKVDHNRQRKSNSPEVERSIHHRSSRSMSRSPVCSKRSRSSHMVSFEKTPGSERRNRHNFRNSNSRSPERRRSNNERYSPRRSGSGGRSRRSRYDRYRRRSPSPDYRRHKYHEKEHRSRSSHHKQRERSDRSRSRSPELRHRRFEERPRHRSRNCRRSRSSSPHCRDSRSRSCSPQRWKDSHVVKNLNDLENSSLRKSTNHKLDEQAQDTQDTIDSYKEELDLLKKELEILKGQVNKGKENKENSSNITNDQSPKITGENVQSSALPVTKTVKQVKVNVPLKNDQINSNIQTVTKEGEVSETNLVESVHSFSLRVSQEKNKPTTPAARSTEDVDVRRIGTQCSPEENRGENNSSVQQTSTEKVCNQLPQDQSRPVIRVKRKSAVRLGDSEVKVVSIK